MLRLMKDGDTLAAIALIALGAMVLWQSLPWDFYSPDGPGPAMFPRIYGIAMIGLSLMLLASRLKSQPDAEKSDFDWVGTRRALATFAAFAISVGAMGYLGFTIPFALFTFFLIVYVFRRPFTTAVITGLALAGVFYGLFSVLLGVQLPTGVIGF